MRKIVSWKTSIIGSVNAKVDESRMRMMPAINVDLTGNL